MKKLYIIIMLIIGIENTQAMDSPPGYSDQELGSPPHYSDIVGSEEEALIPAPKQRASSESSIFEQGEASSVTSSTEDIQSKIKRLLDYKNPRVCFPEVDVQYRTNGKIKTVKGRLSALQTEKRPFLPDRSVVTLLITELGKNPKRTKRELSLNSIIDIQGIYEQEEERKKRLNQVDADVLKNIKTLQPKSKQPATAVTIKYHSNNNSIRTLDGLITSIDTSKGYPELPIMSYGDSGSMKFIPVADIIEIHRYKKINLFSDDNPQFPDELKQLINRYQYQTVKVGFNTPDGEDVITYNVGILSPIEIKQDAIGHVIGESALLTLPDGTTMRLFPSQVVSIESLGKKRSPKTPRKLKKRTSGLL
jgi:hypothetical protein